MPFEVLNRHKSAEWPDDLTGECVIITRGSPFGNPFSHQKGTHAAYVMPSREEALKWFRIWLTSPEMQITGWPKPTREMVKSLYGKHLVCVCAPLSCHGHVLMQLAEEWVREDGGGREAETPEEGVRR